MKVLFLWAVGMLIWGLGGFFEYVTGITPLIALQNAAYPSGVQFVHWLLITLSGGIFLFGYITRWKRTPFVMVLLFSNLAVLCTIQTLDFMSEQWGFPQYFTELAMYVLNSLFLLLAPADTKTKVIIHEDFRGIGVLFWDASWVEQAYADLTHSLRAQVLKANPN